MERLVLVFLLEGVAVCLPMVTYEPLQPLCLGASATQSRPAAPSRAAWQRTRH